MDALSDQIVRLGDAAALATLELVLRNAGLAPEPFAEEHHADQLCEALGQPDLPPLAAPSAEAPTDGNIARATLLYLAERDEAFRESMHPITAQAPEQGVPPTREVGTFTLAALVLLAFHADIELRKQPGKGWYFHFKVKPLPESAVGKVLGMLYEKFIGRGGNAS